MESLTNMLRYLFLNAFIVIHTLCFCIYGAVMALFDRSGGKLVHFFCAVPWAKTILWVSGIKVFAFGREGVDPSVPRIYMTNHQSYFDILGLLACLPVDFKFIMKQELMNIPLFGYTTKKAGYIGIERTDPRKSIQSLNQAAERIRNGASVMIFPEGTRSPTGRLQSFKKGGFHLAMKAGCDIVPIAIRDSYKIVPKGSFKISRGSFSIFIGTPISVSQYTKANVHELMDRVRDEMMQYLGEEKPLETLSR